MDIAVMSPPNMANVTERKHFLGTLNEIEVEQRVAGSTLRAFSDYFLFCWKEQYCFLVLRL